MPFQVVLDGPERNRGELTAGVLLEWLGRVLYTAAALMGFPLCVATLGLLFVLFSAVTTGDWADWATLLTVACLAGWVFFVAGLTIGDRLLRRRRRLVLFLRRFGYTESTRVVSAAAARIGRHWRIVTLDDEQVSPIGAPVGARVVRTVDRTATAANRIGAVAKRVWEIAMTIAGTGLVLSGGYLVLNDQRRGPEKLLALVQLGSSPDSLAESLFQLCGYALFIGLVLGAAALVLVVAWLGAIPFMGLYSIIADDVRMAEHAKMVRIRGLPDIAVTRASLRDRGLAPLAARLTVLTVHTPVWQETVIGIAEECAVPLIDVSEPTENVVWEIGVLLRRFGQRCVFVGQYDRVGALYARAPLGSPVSRVQTLLAGRQVLAYTERDSKRFVKALRAQLEAHARKPLPGSAA